jgi:hypothetical protein
VKNVRIISAGFELEVSGVRAEFGNTGVQHFLAEVFAGVIDLLVIKKKEKEKEKGKRKKKKEKRILK